MADTVYQNNFASGNARVHYGNNFADHITINYSDKSKEKVIRWLNPGDPSIQHNFLQGKHEVNTGLWLIEGTEYADWKRMENSFLWLNAGAGAGKSVICSTIIEDIRTHCRGEQGNADAYWYFTFADGEKQTAVSCLRSIVAQLYHQSASTPEEVQSAYNDCKEGQHQPSHATLLKMLEGIVKRLDSVFITIDALDECPKAGDEREILLNTILNILRWKYPHIHVLCTSRKEIDIEHAFMNYVSPAVKFQVLELAGKDVDADINAFVKARLRERRFAKWDSTLKKDLETRLTHKANGMFRLAALQVDELSQAFTKSALTHALENLPESLDAFYERLLLDIPKELSTQALRALRWVAFSARPISVTELAEAAVASPETMTYVNPDDRFLDVYRLFDIIPAGIVTRVVDSTYDDLSSSALDDPFNGLSGDNDSQSSSADFDYGSRTVVQLAHFSVKEFLLSSRIAQSKVKFFALNEMESHEFIAKVSLVCLLQEARHAFNILEIDLSAKNDSPQLSSDNSISESGSDTSIDEAFRDMAQLFQQIPLLHYATCCWPQHVRNLGDKISHTLISLIIELFTSDIAIKLWDNLYLDHREDLYYFEDIIKSKTQLERWKLVLRHQTPLLPMIYASLLSLEIVVESMVSQNYAVQTRDILDKDQPLHLAAWNGNARIIRDLIDAKADINLQGGRYGTAVQVASLIDQREAVKLLLESGADVNAQGGLYGSALQAASIMSQPEIVELLLEADVDVNAQGGLHGTALLAASTMGRSDIVKLLLEAGADANLNIRDGILPLHTAVYRTCQDVVKILIGSGARIDDRGRPLDNDAYPPYLVTSLQLAVWIGSPELVLLLLDHGANASEQGTVESLLDLALDGKSKSKFGHIGVEKYDDVLLLIQELLHYSTRRTREFFLHPTYLTAPDRWFAEKTEKNAIAFSNKRKEVCFQGKGGSSVTVRADHPFALGHDDFDYFEIDVIKCSQNYEKSYSSFVVIGLCTQVARLNEAVPGWRTFSVGYHSDNGAAYEDKASSDDDQIACGPTFGEGDVVGCGVDWMEEAFFFTLNGTFLRNIKSVHRSWKTFKWYPAIGLGKGASEESPQVRVNFGELPFKYQHSAVKSSGPLDDLKDLTSPSD